jgi:hypothetical protein
MVYNYPPYPPLEKVEQKGKNMKCIYFLFGYFAPLFHSEAYEKWKKGFKDKVFI